MSKSIHFIIAFLFMGIVCMGQGTQAKVPLTPEASLLFQDIKTKLSDSAKNMIAQMSNLKLSPNTGGFVMEGDENYSVNAYPVDLNKDGVEEIFVIENSIRFGKSGSSFSLFIKQGKQYVQVINHQPGTPGILKVIHVGYPDIVIGGPGSDQPVWKFNGKAYTHFRIFRDPNLKVMDVDAASREYVGTIK